MSTVNAMGASFLNILLFLSLHSYTHQAVVLCTVFSKQIWILCHVNRRSWGKWVFSQLSPSHLPVSLALEDPHGWKAVRHGHFGGESGWNCISCLLCQWHFWASDSRRSKKGWFHLLPLPHFIHRSCIAFYPQKSLGNAFSEALGKLLGEEGGRKIHLLLLLCRSISLKQIHLCFGNYSGLKIRVLISFMLKCL